MLYQVRLQLDSATVCSSDGLKGTVVVTVTAAPPQREKFGAPCAVRMLLRGEERRGLRSTIEHLAYVSTVVGESGPGEEAQKAEMLHDITLFTTAGGRHNPLPGVPMHTHGDDDEYTVDGERHGYLQHPASSAPSTSVPPAATRAAPPQEKPALTPLKDWVVGGQYEYPFSLLLPPWLPPSYYYSLKDEESDAWMRYTICAFIATDAPDLAHGSSHRRQTRVLVSKLKTSTRGNDQHQHQHSTSSKSSSKAGKASATNPIKENQGAEAGLVPPCFSNDFDLPSEARRLTGSLALNQVREFVLLSAFPMREFLQCMERVSISPPFSHKLVFHLYKHSLSLTGLTKAPFTDVSVRVTYDSSAAVVLSGRPQSVDHVRAALGLREPRNDADATPGVTGPPEAHHRDSALRGGLTVTGTVVSSVCDADAGKRASRTEKQTQAALDGVLRLRVRVRAGSVNVKKIRLDLFEKVSLFNSSASEKCCTHTHTLATHTHTTNIPANEAVEFVASMKLPRQFRRTRLDSSELLPPAGITTATIHTTTWLQVTLPDLHAVPEQLLGEGVVMVAEDVDLTDTVPFLPNTYHTGDRSSAGPAKAA